MEPVRNYFRAEAHENASLAGLPHYEVVGAAGSGRFVQALAGAFPDATTLYLIGAKFTPAVRQALTPYAEWITTAVPPGTGWPDDWYEATRLRVSAEVFALLASLADEVGAPGLGKAGALFRHDDLVAEWLASPGQATIELLEITSAIPAARLRRFELALFVSAIPVAPAV